MKTCTKCGVPKDRSEFYNHPTTTDGLQGKCKGCAKKYLAEYRRINRDKVIRYYQKNRECIKRYRSKYSQLPHVKAANRIKAKKYAESNPLKVRAHNIVNKALRSGKLIKPGTCSLCPRTGRIEAYHKDYSKPLEVQWVCPYCHKKIHRELLGTKGAMA